VNRSRQEGSVVVAVGDDGNGHAVDWAAAEAAARRSALHVVHVVHSRWAVDPFGLVPVQDLSASATAAEEILHAAVTRARSVASDVDISAQVLSGPTVPSLLLQGRGRQMLVLGGHAPYPRGVRGLLASSVCAEVVTRARCPVVVVRRLLSSAYDGSSPRVVVGVDRSASCTAALDFAFRAAAQRGLPVTAVHAWMPDRPADHEAVSGPVAGSEAGARMVLDQALSDWQSQLVDVPVEARLLCGDPAAALIRESEGAALVVVGSRGRGSARAKVLGSVSRRVAQQAHCPAVVVRPSGKAVQDKGTRAGRRTAVPREDPHRTGGAPVQRRRTPWE
jgi:nucleotide-binding universal stress UspA family protein